MPREDTRLISLTEPDNSWFWPNTFPWPLTHCWRMTHAILYVFGGVTFLLGSICYFPSIANGSWGGWLFTWGSTAFLFADLFEWWTNNRIGCCNAGATGAMMTRFNASVTLLPRVRAIGICPSMENGLNFFMSATGSFLYLLGSIYFIPSLDKIVLGTQIFIVGSAFIFCSQSWKLLRYPNYKEDVAAVHVDAGAGIGGVFYFIGSILFLPQYCVTDEDTTRAAILFTIGGANFLYSGLWIVYRYFFDYPAKY
jgi:hypothetical protein